MSFPGAGALREETKPILRPSGSRGSVIRNSGSFASENINTATVGAFHERPRPPGLEGASPPGAVVRGSAASVSSEDRNFGQSVTITSPIRLDPRDFVDSEPSSLASSLGTSWGGMVKDSDDGESGEEEAEEEEDNNAAGSLRDYSKVALLMKQDGAFAEGHDDV